MATTGDTQEDMENPCGDTTYVVQRGDTLAGVALKLGVTKSELKRANHMYGTISLMTGQTLTVCPSKGPHRRDSDNSGNTANSNAKAQGSERDNESKQRVLPVHGTNDGEDAEFKTWNQESLNEMPPSMGRTPSQGTGMPIANTANRKSPGAEARHVEEPFQAETQPPSVATVSSLSVDAAGDAASKLDRAEFLFTPMNWKTDAESGAGAKTGTGAEGREKSCPRTQESRGSTFRGMIRSVLRTSSARSQGNTHADEAESSERSTRTSSFSVMHSSSVHPDVEVLDRPRAVSSTHALLSMVTPGYWGSRERRDDSSTVDTEALEESARLQGAAGPEDGESEAATDRRRSRSRSEDGGPVAQIMARSRAPSPGPPGLDSDITHILSGGVNALMAPEMDSSTKTPVPLPGLVAGGSTIVSHATIGRMEAALPRHYRGYKWYLLYSTFRDGASYIQFYNRIKDEEPTYLVVENMDGEVFGGFAASAWTSAGKYYGTGECFLYSMHGTRPNSPATDANKSEANNSGAKNGTGKDRGNEMSCSSRSTVEDDMRTTSSPLSSRLPKRDMERSRSPTGTVQTGFQRRRGISIEDEESSGAGGKGSAHRALLEGDIATYGWSGMNTYFQYSDEVGVGMGGGGGSFGLFVGDDLLSGTTGACDTFDNPPLCSREAFDVSQLEVWGFTTASTEVGARMERLRKTLRGRTTRPL